MTNYFMPNIDKLYLFQPGGLLTSTLQTMCVHNGSDTCLLVLKRVWIGLTEAVLGIPSQFYI